MTGMEHAIEHAARTLFLSDRSDTLPAGFPERQWDEGHAVKDDYLRRARALAEAGLLAPAPLTEEWSIWGEDDAGDWELADEFRSREEAEQFMEKNPWTREEGGYLVRRPVHAWLPVDRAEGDGRADQ